MRYIKRLRIKRMNLKFRISYEQIKREKQANKHVHIYIYF